MDKRVSARAQRELKKCRHEFGQWCHRLSASQARSVALGERDPSVRQPEHVSAEEAVGVFLKLHPQFDAHRDELLEHATQRIQGVIVMGKEQWAAEKGKLRDKT